MNTSFLAILKQSIICLCLIVLAALQLFRELERQSLANLHLLGSRLGDCASTSVYFLSDRKEGDPHIATSRFRYDTAAVVSLHLFELLFRSYLTRLMAPQNVTYD